MRLPCPPPWAHGEVHVVSRVVGFKKIKFYTNENVGSGELDLARAGDAHDRLLVHDPARADDVAALRRRRPAGRRHRPVVRDAADRAAAADVRPPRHRRVDRQRQRVDGGRARRRGRQRASSAVQAGAARISTSRASSSTTITRAASGCPSRCSRCAHAVLDKTRDLIATLSVRVGLPVVRRPARRRRPAGEDRGAGHPEQACE